MEENVESRLSNCVNSSNRLSILSEFLEKGPSQLHSICHYLTSLQNTPLYVDLTIFLHGNFKRFRKSPTDLLQNTCHTICMELHRLNWVSWIQSNAMNMISLEVVYYTLVLLIDLIKFCNSMDDMGVVHAHMEMKDIQMEFILKWLMTKGHPISRKCIQFISIYTTSMGNVPSQISRGILEYMQSLYNQKEFFKDWFDTISTPSYTEFCLSVGSFDRQTASLLVLLLYQWALLESCRNSELESLFEFVFKSSRGNSEECQDLEKLEQCAWIEHGWALVSHQDDQLFLILLHQLELDLQNQSLFDNVDSHSLFLFSLEKLGYSVSTFIDFLMSNETVFLEYFVKYLKFLEISMQDFSLKCKNKAQIVLFFMDLHQALINITDTFPYSPRPLIKRLWNVISLFSSTCS